MALTVVEASRLLWCPGLAQLTVNPSGTLHKWLTSATYAPIVSGKNLLLSNLDRRQFLEALGSDINRTASAASETLKNITELTQLPKSLAWPYVKLYYASLFYAHAMLRIWGRSPSYFRTLELMPLRNMLAAYGIVSPFSINTGQYIVKADLNVSTVEFSLDSGGGGSHEAVWREFNRALLDLQVAVATGQYLSADKTAVDQQIKSLIALISKSNKNLSWPSQMRNDIQYRQSEGLWYPYERKVKTSALQHEVTEIMCGKVDFLSLLSSSGDDLSQFRSACYAVILLGRSTISDMASVGGVKSFLRFGQRKFEDHIVKQK